MTITREIGVLVQIVDRDQGFTVPCSVPEGSYPAMVVAPDGSYFTVTFNGDIEGDPASVERALMAIAPGNQFAAVGALALTRLALRKVRPN